MIITITIMADAAAGATHALAAGAWTMPPSVY